MNQGAQRYLAERLMVARDRPSQIEIFQWRQQMLAGFGGAIEALRAADAWIPMRSTTGTTECMWPSD